MHEITVTYRVAEGQPIQTVKVEMIKLQTTLKEFEKNGYIIESVGSGWQSF